MPIRIAVERNQPNLAALRGELEAALGAAFAGGPSYDDFLGEAFAYLTDGANQAAQDTATATIVAHDESTETSDQVTLRTALADVADLRDNIATAIASYQDARASWAGWTAGQKDQHLHFQNLVILKMLRGFDFLVRYLVRLE